MLDSQKYVVRRQVFERTPFSLVLLGTLAVVLCFAYLLGYVNQMNSTYEYTYFRPINQTGTLSSSRLKPLWWIEFLVGIFRLAFLFMTALRVAMYKSPWVVNFHLFVTLLFLVSEISGAVLYGMEYECCNNSPSDTDCSGAGNRCNDYRWCCTYGHLADVCPNYNAPAFGCSPNVTESELKPNIEFSISFALVLGHAAFGVLAICLSYAAKKTLLVKEQYVEMAGKKSRRSRFDFENDSIGGEMKQGNAKKDDGDDSSVELSDSPNGTNDLSGYRLT